MRKASLIVILLVLLASLFLLSVLSNTLTGYPERSRPPETEEKRTTRDAEDEPSILLFKVSPVTPRLYWRVSTADHYTGLDWHRTTDENILEEFPRVLDANATKLFTVELNLSQRETLLPLPPPDSTLGNLSYAPIESLEFYGDTVGGTHKAIKHGQAEVPLAYEVSWNDVEVDDRLISPGSIPEDVLDKYLQLPNLPIEVWELAEDLEVSSYSILDQVLADVQFLRTNFVYDVERSQYLYERISQGSDVSSYIRLRKGMCMDAATALAVILRIQEIPARISIGYKPGPIEGGKLSYYSDKAHAVTEVYLPPYGWLQFDATPPLEEDPLLKVLPFKKESSPGRRLFYQLSVTNRRNSTESFKLFVSSKQKWNVEVAPKELKIDAFQAADALLEVTIPDDVDIGEKDVIRVTVASLSHSGVAFSILAIVEVENVLHISTTTILRNIDEAVIRGDAIPVSGAVLAAGDEQVDNMTVFIFLTKGRETEGVIVGKTYSIQGIFQIEIAIPQSIEIGDYKVIAISLGTTRYAPSSSTSPIRVLATTRIEFDPEEEFLLGYGAIHGRLLWDNGTGFAETSISLQITSLATPSEVWELQNQTCEDGSFRIETTLENSGIYEIEATFSGNEYVIGSNATCAIELKRGLPSIQISGENVAVRGEVFNITVTIQYQDIRVWGEPVTVTFDNQLLAITETRDNGSFTQSFLVDSEETLGSHIFTVSLKKGNVSAIHKVTVKSKTRLDTRVSDVAGGMFLLFSLSLSDDHGLPIQEAEIVVDNYGLSRETDKNGNLTFLLDTAKLWPENLVLIARFEGLQSYLPATTEKEVVLQPMITLPFLIPLVSPALLVVVFASAKRLVGRLQALRQTTDMGVVEERAMVAEEIPFRPQKIQPLNFVLPDIEAGFPNVWGVKDRLHIGIVLDKSALEKIQGREVEVLVDKETVASVTLSQQGRAELCHVFVQKGERKMRGILPRTSGRPPWNAEINLRVVDYREEIIRLYNEFLGRLASHGIRARNEMTAREIESLLLRKSSFSPEALHRVTFCFEKAEYSNHLATRKDYRIMYLSLKELNVDVE